MNSVEKSFTLQGYQFDIVLNDKGRYTEDYQVRVSKNGEVNFLENGKELFVTLEDCYLSILQFLETVEFYQGGDL